ncbi:unnamed protein product [Brugia timori]|uniref:Secreted protein n=1 Tax=Brugia timori TaxID=42155 RepID=A0A0R3R072_9BILA|nr:unnamed protein product [Brugia timori]
MNNFQDKLVSPLLKMQNIASTVSLLFSAILVLGHQAPSFPDHNAQKPLEVIFFCGVNIEILKNLQQNY